jgi:nucleoporin p58/p45
LTVVASSLVPGVAATLITLRVCAVENACASSCDENTDGEKTDGENTLGLNTDGENTLGLNTDGENTLGLNTDGENTLGLNTDGENTLGLNTDGLNTDGENTLGLNTDGAYSAVSLTRSDVLALPGVNCFANACPMSRKTARS